MATSSTFITRATRKQALEERGLIRSQLRLGAGLIALGALSIPLFQMSGVLDGQAATAAFAVATAVIGAARPCCRPAPPRRQRRILRSLPDQDAVAEDQHAAPTAIPTTAGSRPDGSEHDHADPPPPRATDRPASISSGRRGRRVAAEAGHS